MVWPCLPLWPQLYYISLEPWGCHTTAFDIMMIPDLSFLNSVIFVLCNLHLAFVIFKVSDHKLNL